MPAAPADIPPRLLTALKLCIGLATAALGVAGYCALHGPAPVVDVAGAGATGLTAAAAALSLARGLLRA